MDVAGTCHPRFCQSVFARGGESIITYLSGEHDAARVVTEITDWGGHAKSIHGDVSNPEALVKALLETGAPTHLYYFATPHVTAQKNLELNEALYQSYARIYIDAFERLIAMLAQHTLHTLNVFYPSSIFVEEQPKYFAEYTKAKEIGEKICASLNEKYKNINIIIHRLHRMKTDQTASLLAVATKPALQEMQRVVLQMSAQESSYDTHNSN